MVACHHVRFEPAGRKITPPQSGVLQYAGRDWPVARYETNHPASKWTRNIAPHMCGNRGMEGRVSGFRYRPKLQCELRNPPQIPAPMPASLGITRRLCIEQNDYRNRPSESFQTTRALKCQYSAKAVAGHRPPAAAVAFREYKPQIG